MKKIWLKEQEFKKEKGLWSGAYILFPDMAGWMLRVPVAGIGFILLRHKDAVLEKKGMQFPLCGLLKLT